MKISNSFMRWIQISTIFKASKNLSLKQKKITKKQNYTKNTTTKR